MGLHLDMATLATCAHLGVYIQTAARCGTFIGVFLFTNFCLFDHPKMSATCAQGFAQLGAHVHPQARLFRTLN